MTHFSFLFLMPIAMALTSTANGNVISKKVNERVIVLHAAQNLKCFISADGHAFAVLKEMAISPVALNGHNYSVESPVKGTALCDKVKEFIDTAGEVHPGVGKTIYGTASTVLELNKDWLEESVDLILINPGDSSQSLSFHSRARQYLEIK